MMAARTFRRDDLQYVRDIDLKTSDTPWEIEQWDAAGDRGDVCIVGTLFGTPVAFAVASQDGRIHKLAVRDSHRRKGFGNLLLYALREWAEGSGLTELTVCVPETECHPGHPGDRCGFFLKEGFLGLAVERDVRNVYGRVEDGMVLLWRLHGWSETQGKRQFQGSGKTSTL